ncbi:MAG: glycoside hydrolase family 3 protein, partial [Rudaea sp.]
PGNANVGTTILDGIKQTVSSSTRVEYEADGDFGAAKDAAGAPLIADASIIVVGEKPYAEGKGDRADMSLATADAELIDRVKARSKRVVVVLISGRPLVVTEQLPKWDAFVAAWLPGTEGSGVADGLFGNTPFSGKLPYTWPRWSSQLPLNVNMGVREGCDGPLFPFGFGLTAEMESPPQLDCPAK